MVGRAVNDNWRLWALIGVVAGPAAWFLWSIPIAVITFDPSKVPTPPVSTTGSTPAPTPPASEPEAADSEESPNLSSYAQKQLLTAQSYSKQGLNHIEQAKQYNSSNDFRSVCKEFGNADRAMNAASESLVPVAREIQMKKPEAMSAILGSGKSLAESLESGLVLCRQMGLSWGG
jgi:hypothetical protein